MSNSQRPEKDSKENTPDIERSVMRYLREHPDFFEQHLELLAGMHLPHREGQTVSLIEKQVSVLRDQKDELRRKLNFIIKNAEHNDDLRNRMDDLVLHLLDAKTLDDVFDILQHRLKHDFEADYVVVKLFNSNHPAMASHPEALHWQAPALNVFEKVLRGRKPVCGQFKPAQLQALFTEGANEIASAALVPLVESDTSTHSYGMLAIGSQQADRFRADMGTQFLAHLGKIIARIIKNHFG